jgi:hypothetical protein
MKTWKVRVMVGKATWFSWQCPDEKTAREKAASVSTGGFRHTRRGGTVEYWLPHMIQRLEVMPPKAQRGGNPPPRAPPATSAPSAGDSLDTTFAAEISHMEYFHVLI